jgi:hypothetical protein
MKVYCDLDGVLVDFNGKFKETFGEDPDVFEKNNGARGFWKSIENRGPEYWSTMNWLPNAKRIWYYLLDNFEEVEILTGSPFGLAGQYAKEGKNKWCKRELGNVKVNHKQGRLKWEFSNENTLLVDDTEKVVNLWLEKGKGEAILHKDIMETLKKLEIIKNGKS